MFFQANYKYQYPIRLLYGFLNANSENHQIPIAFPATTDWGEVIPDEVHKICCGTRIDLELGWLALDDRKIFYFRGSLDLPKEVVESDMFTLIIGLGNKGEVAIWLYHELKSSLILYTHGLDISEKISDKMIAEANILDDDGKRINSVTDLCTSDLSKFGQLPKSKLTAENCIENRMKRFAYRYRVIFESEPMEYSFAEFLYDGSFDKTATSKSIQYKESAKPRRLAIKWLSEEYVDSKNEYSVYIWLDESDIAKIFERFYGVHPETKTDFIIRIDAENKKYELALYRQGLNEPVVIPTSAYQLIVFKNKFEDYRSENYNQPRGAWIW